MDAQKTGDAIEQIILSSPMRSFFSTPVFQIDGILGGTAGIAEALLQSHTGIVHLLPALPPRWTEGEVKGLVARGGVTVDLTWSGGTLTSARLHAAHTAPVKVRADVPFRILRDGNPVTGAETPYGLRFDAEAGAEYYLEVI
ncbi:MAG: hypothetical protein GX604_08585 [Actinobacteria bacterium]|nr:hypothetical protein [Actinomycetota bacterium]